MIAIVQQRKPDKINEEIRKAYEALKDDNGKVMKDYLKNLLQNTGEKLTPDEVTPYSFISHHAIMRNMTSLK